MCDLEAQYNSSGGTNQLTRMNQADKKPRAACTSYDNVSENWVRSCY